ncbi:hypothetical protein [Paenibacillus periandrae]|uniref:hypothetical protein n=1 Tax=Paenibacillus periandrae TaxID=1761741 RepID=UPI001F08C8CE|nr:hypothetical protein [Paenibacillus periandrae]
MRIEGIHPTGARIEIIRNNVRIYEVSCYDTNGSLVFWSTFRNPELAKSQARKQFDTNGKWTWNTLIDLRAQEVKFNFKSINHDLTAKRHLTKNEAFVVIHKDCIVKSDIANGYITLKKKRFGIYEIQTFEFDVIDPETSSVKLNTLKEIMDSLDNYYTDVFY